jgi:hypothetical protein
MNACLKIPGIRFKAVCDIWTAYNQKRVSRTLKAYRHAVNTYVDYKEMLDKEKDLDAVIIATPDFWHSPHAVACLEAGLNVYCEKEMSNTLEGARKMAEAAKKTGKLLQIGHQRRSNPRYRHVYDKLITGTKLLGKITCINGQWNRSKAACEDLGFPKNAAIEKATLEEYVRSLISVRIRLTSIAGSLAQIPGPLWPAVVSTTGKGTTGMTMSWSSTSIRSVTGRSGPSIRQ